MQTARNPNPNPNPDPDPNPNQVSPPEAREARLIPLRGAAYLVAALLIVLVMLAVRVHRATRAAAQARAHLEKRLAQALRRKGP